MQLNLLPARGAPLADPHGAGPPLALVTGFGGGVRGFGHPVPGTAVAAGVRFTAEPAPQFHLDLGAMALGNPVEKGVLVAGVHAGADSLGPGGRSGHAASVVVTVRVWSPKLAMSSRRPPSAST
jgi:hypothetical protein